MTMPIAIACILAALFGGATVGFLGAALLCMARSDRCSRCDDAARGTLPTEAKQ